MPKQIKDYPELTQAKDGDLLLCFDSSNNTTKKIKLSTLKTYLSSTTEKTATLTYTLSGDSNGLFYYLGTTGTGSGWSNPFLSNLIVLSASSFFDSSNSDLSRLVNRLDDNGIATANQVNSWIKIDLRQRTLLPSYYSVRARQFNANLIRNWKMQASNDDTTWIDLDTRVSNNLAASQWFSVAISTTNYYRYFRILQTGLSSSSDNILTLGEVELYGILKGAF